MPLSRPIHGFCLGWVGAIVQRWARLQVSLDEPDISLSRNDRTIQQNVSPSDLFEAVFILEAIRVPIKAVGFIFRSSE
jgi:hypothetical protein